MILQDILVAKGADVRTIDPTATVDEAVAELVRHNIGSLVVVGHATDDEPGPMLGIITERDILRAWAMRQTSPDQLRVEEVMTRDVMTGKLDQDISSTMGLLTEKRIRHLPILEDGRLCGMISIGDVVKAQHDEMAMENHYLKNYLHG